MSDFQIEFQLANTRVGRRWTL